VRRKVMTRTYLLPSSPCGSSCASPGPPFSSFALLLPSHDQQQGKESATTPRHCFLHLRSTGCGLRATCELHGIGESAMLMLLARRLHPALRTRPRGVRPLQMMAAMLPHRRCHHRPWRPPAQGGPPCVTLMRDRQTDSTLTSVNCWFLRDSSDSILIAMILMLKQNRTEQEDLDDSSSKYLLSKKGSINSNRPLQGGEVGLITPPLCLAGGRHHRCALRLCCLSATVASGEASATAVSTGEGGHRVVNG
jgi:hypothetical protein